MSGESESGPPTGVTPVACRKPRRQAVHEIEFFYRAIKQRIVFAAYNISECYVSVLCPVKMLVAAARLVREAV